MNKDLIKTKLHQIIDQLEDKPALQKLYAAALDLKYSLAEEDELPEETWEEINLGLAQLRNDEPCTHLGAIEKFMQWQHRK